VPVRVPLKSAKPHFRSRQEVTVVRGELSDYRLISMPRPPLNGTPAAAHLHPTEIIPSDGKSTCECNRGVVTFARRSANVENIDFRFLFA
jgi:hypothetical protein